MWTAATPTAPSLPWPTKAELQPTALRSSPDSNYTLSEAVLGGSSSVEMKSAAESVAVGGGGGGGVSVGGKRPR